MQLDVSKYIGALKIVLKLDELALLIFRFVLQIGCTSRLIMQVMFERVSMFDLCGPQYKVSGVSTLCVCQMKSVINN